MKISIIGVDIGATSGRVILSTIDNSIITNEEISRFPNSIISINGRCFWDIYAIYNHIVEALTIVGRRGIDVRSIGIDTWGVDFVYVGQDGHFLSMPRAYRDPYTLGAPEEMFEKISREDLYSKTGVQIMNFNSIFQLYAANKEGNAALAAADKILFIPDALSYMLTGKMVCEYTILSTSQFMNPYTKSVDKSILSAAGVSSSLFPEVVMPGDTIGKLSDSVAAKTGLHGVEVVAVAGHDTGSAVAAVPASTGAFAYLSSGTWSLMGVEVVEPIINHESCRMNFTNEGGVDGTLRFLKNITGMWLLEECRKNWAKDGKEYPYPQIVEMTTSTAAHQHFIDPDDPCFANPQNMIEAICDYCRATCQKSIESDAQIMRCIFDSLALKYRSVFEKLESMSPFKIEVLHIIGGGAKNDLLNQLTANSVGVKVIVGPSEATVFGNIAIQARTAGVVDSLPSMRELVKNSVTTKEFMPQDSDQWQLSYDKFVETINKKR